MCGGSKSPFRTVNDLCQLTYYVSLSLRVSSKGEPFEDRSPCEFVPTDDPEDFTNHTNGTWCVSTRESYFIARLYNLPLTDNLFSMPIFTFNVYICTVVER